MPQWLPWREAVARALYGTGGFYLRPEGPGGHFRTSATAAGASALFAGALLRLVAEVDAALGRPPALDVVDVGAGRGELLAALAGAAGPDLRPRLRLRGVDVVPRPPGLPADVAWSARVPRGLRGLVVANEWLDDVPVDVVERSADGVRLVLVDPESGAERLADTALRDDDRRWLDAWWPLDAAEAGDRAEVGGPRDEAWAAVVAALEAGVAVAIDYAHSLADRSRGLLPAGTMTGYRQGRACVPLPDGSCDVTCHVALDACAAAGERVGATATLLLSQREALRALGVHGRGPGPYAGGDPLAYLAMLRDAGAAAELTARGGLGDFGWLVQAVGVPLPRALVGASVPQLVP